MRAKLREARTALAARERELEVTTRMLERLGAEKAELQVGQSKYLGPKSWNPNEGKGGLVSSHALACVTPSLKPWL